MKKLLLLLTSVFALMTIPSCTEDDNDPMVWEFSNYDLSIISAAYTPGFVNEAVITIAAEYKGDITLTCTNYPQLTLTSNDSDGTFNSTNAKFSVSKIDNTSLKISFEPLDYVPIDGINDFIYTSGHNGNRTYLSNIKVTRISQEGM